MAIPQENQESNAPQVQTEIAHGTITCRSMALGLVVAVFVILWNTYVEYIAHTGRINITHFPVALFAPFTVLALLNGFLRHRKVSWAFEPTEMLVVVAMGLVGAAVPAYGLTSYFLGVIAIPFYRATPENQWAPFFHQYLPEWLIPTNEGDAMRWLFEGLPSPEMQIPWSVWFVPLAGWMVFIGAIVLGSITIAIMLRKQWADYERITYPILHPARDLSESGEPSIGILRNKLFWIGFGVPFLIICFNMISYFSPGFPRISLYRGWMPTIEYFPSIHVNVNWYTIGFAYFANVDVLLSIVVFYMWYWFQVGIYRRIGIGLSKKSNTKGDATVSLQSAGAFLSLVLWGLWLARSHLKDIFTKAFRPSHPVDDSDELMSYRTCVFGFLFSFIFIVFWLNSVGIAIHVAFVLTAGIFMSYIGVARVIAESGVVYYSMNLSGEGLINFLFGGPNVFDPSTKTALRVVAAIRSQGKGMFMPPLVHAIRIAGSIEHNRRRIVPALFTTIFVGLGCAIAYSLYLGYTWGAYNFNDYPFTRYPPGLYDGLVKALKGEIKWEPQRYTFFGMGIATYFLVSMLRYRLSWWPLTPIGLIVPMTHAIHSIFSIFVAWGTKSILLRLGGVNLYRRCRPIFVGLLAGHACGVLLSFIVDQIWFPGQGHGTHGW